MNVRDPGYLAAVNNSYEDPQRFVRLRQQLVQVYHFTAPEISALSRFKGPEGRILNFKLRLQKPSAAELEVAHHLDTALEKLPLCQEEIIYRNILFDPEQQQEAIKFFRAHKGRVVRFPEFLHYTKKEKFTGCDEDFSFIIQLHLAEATRGRDIDHVWKDNGFRENEEEISFTWNSCFRVRDVPANTPITLVLEETGDDPNAVVVPNF